MYEGKAHDFETEQDASTLKSAHEIRSDPKRHKKAVKHMRTASKMHRAAARHEEDFAATKNSRASATNGEGSPAEEQNESAQDEQSEGV